MAEYSTDTPQTSAAEPAETLACSLCASGCITHKVSKTLQDHGLRPTRQRVALGRLLYGDGDRHVTAEILHAEAVSVSVPVSLATVYNTLHQFTEAGLLRQLPVDGTKMWFDTNISDHHHFLLEDENQILDIPDQNIAIANIEDVPEGMEIARIEVVVRLRRKTGTVARHGKICPVQTETRIAKDLP
jgi:Fur family iron response transcriptional regulator